MPNRAVFDTNILIDYTRNIDGAVRVIQSCADRLISLVTWIEFLAGFPYEQQDLSRAFLRDNFDIISPDDDISDQVVEFRRRKMFKLPDAMIYATARIYGVPLVTRNTKDFDEKAPDIHVPYHI